MKKLLLLCLTALFSVATWAADFSVTNENNVEIFYNIVDDGVEVTWGGDSYSSTGTESYVGSLVIPASVSNEGTPYTVVGVGDHAFYYCAELTAVSLPETITSIGSYAFYHCTALIEMSLPEAVTSVDSYAFYYCTALTSIKLSNSLTTIPAYCFYNCNNLGSVTLPTTITTIGNYAFDNCWAMTSINLPEGLVSIGEGAFYGSGVTSIEFPSTLTTLGDDAFMDASLTSVYVPKTITSIGASAFQECRSLTDVTLEEGLTSLSWNMFYDCESLEKITIPSSITDMGVMAFASCYSLSEVTLTEGITAAIGMYTFNSCQSLESINIPGSVKEIGMYAFENCSQLSDVTLNTGLETIGENAFAECETLQQITIPSTVTSIGYSAFECQELQEVTVLNPTPPTIEDYVFGGEEVTTYVPAGTLAEYENEWYTHSWNLSFEELDYAVLKITLADNSGVGYATYYNGGYDVTIPEGITAYWAESVEDGVVTLTEIEGSIPAETAVVLKGDLTDITEANATPSTSRSSYTDNLLHGQSLTGMLEEEEDGAYLYYMLTTNTDGTNLGFYWGNSNGSAFSSKANKAWLAVPAGQSNALSIKFKDKEETTGITSVETEVGTTTVSGIYTLQGVRVSDMNQKGVYIVNGKKVLVK